jgi:hexosaminidase
LTTHEKQMMMWGDITLEHPEILDQLPKDILMLTWDYSARESFVNSIQPFRNNGFDVIVCPGVSCWNRIFPDFHTARINIRNYVRDGINLGTMGMLNTTWDDDGENLFTYNWYGLAYGADQAWNPGVTDDESFNRRYSGAVYGDAQNNIAKAVEKISELHQLSAGNGLTNSLFWKKILPEWGQTVRVKISEWHPIPNYTSSIDSLLKLAQPGHYSSDLNYLQFANIRLRFLYQFRRNLIQASQWYREACLSPTNQEDADSLLRESWRALATSLQDLQNLRETYRQLWFAENRIHWLERNLKKYDTLLSELGEIIHLLERAIAYHEQNLPLPSPCEIRLSATELQGAFLTNWLISGPYPNENQEGLKKDYLKEIGGETAAFPKPTAPNALRTASAMNWQLVKSTNPLLKFTAYFDEITNKVAYAFATIYSSQPLPIELSAGSDDGIKIFLNGKVVHEHALARSHEADADQIKARLTQGVNRLLVKVDQGVGDWGFSVRLVGARVQGGDEANYVIGGE